MPGIYKVQRKGKSRGLRWGVYYDGPGGRRVRRIVGTKAEAQQELGRLLAGTAHGVAPATATLEDLRRLWWEANEGAERLTKRDAGMWPRLERALGGPRRRLSTLTPGQVDRAVAHLQGVESPRTKRPLSASTVNRHLFLLRSACRLAVREGLLSHDPTAWTPALPVHDERDRICSPSEEATLLALATPDLRIAIVLALDTGMRAGEIRRLDWARIDLGGRLVRLGTEHTKARRRRVVPLTPRAAEALRARREARPGDATLYSPIPSQSLFAVRFCKLVRKAGVEDLRFHDLRHTAATRLRRAGVDPITIMRICGWRSPASLLRYQSVDHGELVAAADALNKKI